MSIPDIYPGGFTTKTRLTSAVMNLVRTYLQRALDGQNGGSYTLSSNLTLNGAGKFELGDQLQYTARSRTVFVPIVPTVQTGYSPNNYGVWNTTGTTLRLLEVPFRLPAGNTITACSVTHQPATDAAHGGGAPGGMPKLRLYKVNGSGTNTQIGSTATDTFGSKAAYEAEHSFGLSSLTEVTSNSFLYVLQYECENGANSAAGTAIKSLSVTLSITKQAEI